MSALEQLTRMPLAKKIFLLVFILILFGAGFWFFFYSGKSEELDSLVKQHATLQDQLKEAERKKKTYEEDRQKRDDLKKASTKQFQMLPPEPEMSSFLNSLNTQADLVGLDILSVKPLDEEAAEYYARIPVRLVLDGTFHQLAKFFYLVGNLDRIINIENINLGNTSMDESEVTMTAEILATTFRSVRVGEELDGKGKKKKKKGKK